MTPYTEMLVQKRMHKYENWEERHIVGVRFEVKENFHTESIEFEHRRCTCGKWKKSVYLVAML